VRPEVLLLLEGLAIWLALLLLVPKRSWRTLSQRFTDTLEARRRWVFEPAGVRSKTPAPPLQTEGLRALELGVPIYVAVRFAERKSMSDRREAEKRWQASSSAVLLDLLQGRIDEAESQRRLRARGFSQPAEKAVALRPSVRAAVPVDWFIERETARTDGDGSAPQLNGAPPSTLVGALEVRTLGAFVLRDGGEDLTAALLKSRVLSFIWLYLLVRAILSPDGRISRAELAEELTPGLNPERQRKRLRDRLRNLLADLPPGLTRPIRMEDDFLQFTVRACSLDIFRLFDLARDAAGKDGMLSDALAAEIEGMLAQADGEFLPVWDELEHEVTGGRGAGGELVRDIRQKAEDSRVSLLSALALNRLARREAGRAIPLLEQALERRPDREDLARNLRAAYLESGQPNRAAAVQRDYSLD